MNSVVPINQYLLLHGKWKGRNQRKRVPLTGGGTPGPTSSIFAWPTKQKIGEGITVNDTLTKRSLHKQSLYKAERRRHALNRPDHVLCRGFEQKTQNARLPRVTDIFYLPLTEGFAWGQWTTGYNWILQAMRWKAMKFSDCLAVIVHLPDFYCPMGSMSIIKHCPAHAVRDTLGEGDVDNRINISVLIDWYMYTRTSIIYIGVNRLVHVHSYIYNIYQC